MKNLTWVLVVGSWCLGCAATHALNPDDPIPLALEPPIAEDPEALLDALGVAPPVMIVNAILLTAEEDVPSIEGWIRLRDGRISARGEGAAPPASADELVLDAKGGYLTPGLIDTHSHMGVYANPGVWAHSDGNEASRPVTAGVRAEDAFWPQDPSIERAVGGGVTTIQVLPGSANLMGGRGVVLKLHPRREARAMRFPGAKDSLKMACGENPKRVYGKHRKSMPRSRMGSIFLMRNQWIAARRYQHDWANWTRQKTRKVNGREVPITPPKRDLVLETLVHVLEGDVLVHVHCYRADEMLLQLRLAEEFGFLIRSFHHAVEAYKIRDVLAEREVSVSTWADWWGFKIEAYDAVEQNLALLSEAKVRAIVHSDSSEGIQRLNQEAAKAYYAGLHRGVKVDAHQALRWITANPAWALGISDQTGTLAVGKMADVVLWEGHPFSVYAKAKKVFIDGHVRHDATQPSPQPWSDFEVGQ